MEQEADTEFYMGYRIDREQYSVSGQKSVTATRLGATTLSGIGTTYEAAIEDAKRRIDAIQERDLGIVTVQTEQDGSKVIARLSGGNWAGLLTVAAGIIGAVFSGSWETQGRLTTAETKLAAHEKRLDAGETRDKELRDEILTEIRGLRVELRQK